MTFVEDDDVAFPGFISREYVPSKYGVVVSTRVPTNLFDYNSLGSIITITGGVIMQLVESGRKLHSGFGGTTRILGNEKASYQLKVDLQDETVLKDEVSMTTIEDSCSVVDVKRFSVIGTVFGFSCSML